LALVGAVFASTGNGGRRRLPVISGFYSGAIDYPCRFDCLQLVTKSTGAAIFGSCSSSVVSYAGDYFGKTGNNFAIDYQCFTPATYQNYFASRGKLAHLISICQDSTHRCRKSNGQTFNTDAGNNNQYAGLPNIANLGVVTTSKYYQWYSQFTNLVVINNVVRCPSTYLRNRNGINKCNCDLIEIPELFSASNAKMPTATSDTYKKVSDVPTPVSPYTSYVQGFLGNFSTPINPGPTVQGDRRALLSAARLVLPQVSVAVHLGCVDDDVDITSECDSDADD